MKKLLAGAALAVGFTVSASAMASNHFEPYLFADVGYNSPTEEKFEITSEDNNFFSVGFGIDLGEQATVELGYHDLGKYNDKSYEGIGLKATKGMMLSPGTKLFGSVGMMSVDTDRRAEVATFGAGVSYFITHNIDLRVQYDRIHNIKSESGKFSSDKIGIGASLRF